MKNQILNLYEVITSIFREKSKLLNTSLPGVIKSFDSANQTVDVYPAIKRVFVDGEEPIRVLTKVPVIFPTFGGFTITRNIVEGDRCLIVFCQRDIQAYIKSGIIAAPPVKRFHSLSDGVAIMGLVPNVEKIENFSTSALEIRTLDNSVKISITPGGQVDIICETASVSGDLEVEGDLTVSGSTALGTAVTSNGINISGTHIHPQAPDSQGGTQVPTGPPQ